MNLMTDTSCCLVSERRKAGFEFTETKVALQEFLCSNHLREYGLYRALSPAEREKQTMPLFNMGALLQGHQSLNLDEIQAMLEVVASKRTMLTQTELGLLQGLLMVVRQSHYKTAKMFTRVKDFCYHLGGLTESISYTSAPLEIQVSTMVNPFPGFNLDQYLFPEPGLNVLVRSEPRTQGWWKIRQTAIRSFWRVLKEGEAPPTVALTRELPLLPPPDVFRQPLPRSRERDPVDLPRRVVPEVLLLPPPVILRQPLSRPRERAPVNVPPKRVTLELNQRKRRSSPRISDLFEKFLGTVYFTPKKIPNFPWKEIKQ